jgi:hypothetical protein
MAKSAYPVKSKKLKPAQRARVSSFTEDTLKRLLEFKVSCDVIRLLVSDAESQYRYFEDRLHVGYPVRGAGVRALRSAMDMKFELSMVDDQDLEPSLAVTKLGEFPLEAAAASYIFTILERHGDALVSIANRGYFRSSGVPRFASWHHLVFGDADIGKPEVLTDMRKRYGKPFLQSSSTVRFRSVANLVELKRLRNAYAHDLESSINLDEYFRLIISIVCDLEFMLVPESVLVKEFPFYDFNDSWGRLGPPYHPEDEWEEAELMELEEGQGD